MDGWITDGYIFLVCFLDKKNKKLMTSRNFRPAFLELRQVDSASWGVFKPSQIWKKKRAMKM